MTDAERWEEEYCECPCGKGHIKVSVISPNRPFAETRRDYFIACRRCSAVWEIDATGKVLVDKSSSQKAKSLESERSRLNQELDTIGRPAVKRYFESLALKAKTRELEMLRQLKMSRYNITQYRRERCSRSIAGLAVPHSNPEWVAANCDEESKARARTIASRLEELSAEIKEAKAAVIRRRIEKTS